MIYNVKDLSLNNDLTLNLMPCIGYITTLAAAGLCVTTHPTMSPITKFLLITTYNPYK